jgi:hypothetical protein
MATAWCGCSDDWAVINPDKTPTEFESGVFAHGIDSERKRRHTRIRPVGKSSSRASFHAQTIPHNRED